MHPKTEPKEGHPLFPGPANRCNLSIDATVAEATGHDDGVHSAQECIGAVRFNLFGADPVQVEGGILGNAGMLQRFDDGEIGVVQLHVLAHQGNLHRWAGIAQLVDQLFPCRHVAVMVGQVQHVQHFTAQTLLLKDQRHGIDAVGIQRGNHGAGGHPAEAADFPLEIVADVAITAADEHIRLDADRTQFLDRVLCGLGFEFAGGADEGQQGDVDVGQVVATHVLPEFTDGFEEGQ